MTNTPALRFWIVILLPALALGCEDLEPILTEDATVLNPSQADASMPDAAAPGPSKATFCGDEGPCSTASTASADTSVRASDANANFGSERTLLLGYDPNENRVLLEFSLVELLGSVSKHAELATARLSLFPEAGALHASPTLSAHVMTRAWTPLGATWSCADDRAPGGKPSNCAASDAWSMTAGALPYQTAAVTATLSPLSALAPVVLDVSHDVQEAMDEDASTISWLLQLSSGSLCLGAMEGQRPAQLELSFRPPTRQAEQRNERLKTRAAAILDPRKEGYAAWAGWASTCELARAVEGKSSEPTFMALAADFSPEDGAAVQRIAADLRSIPSALATQILGPFAQLDPRACQEPPAFQQAAIIDRASADLAHLRTNFCSEADGSITVGAEEVVAPTAVLDTAGAQPGRMASLARPVITGVDPTFYIPDGETSAAASAELGHPALLDDWKRNRGGESTSDDLFPGDGLSAFGTPTDVACDTSSTLTNDRCDHAAGLVCSHLVGFGGEWPGKCLAFPIVPRHELLWLRGHNFWDPDAALSFERLGDPSATSVTDAMSSTANENLKVDESCTPAAAMRTRPSLFAKKRNNHNLLAFWVEVPGGFWKLRLYNKNGVFRTQRDKFDGKIEGRTIHVCRNEQTPDEYEQGTEGTNHGCTPPSEACAQDGGHCAATWTTPPRSLQECSNDSVPVPGVPDECGETPMFFASEEQDVIVYVAPERPTFTYRTFLDRMECAEETGCNHCGGEDEFRVVMGSLTARAIEGLSKDPRGLRNATVAVYKGDFNHRDIKHPETMLQQLTGIRRSDDLITWMQFVEEDRETVTRTKVIGSIVTGAAAGVAGYYGGAGGAAAATAIGAGLMSWVIAAAEGADDLGSRSWQGNYWDVQARVNFTHKNDFLIAQSRPDSLSMLPPDPGGSGRYASTLLHPVVGYGRHIEDTRVECGQSDPALPVCSGSEFCYVNQCIGTSERDGALMWPSGFHDPQVDDPLWGTGFRVRQDLTHGGGSYKGDFEYVLCPESPQVAPSVRCQ